ncbi:MAG TPA: hypothetical protein VFZ83_06485 [Acidimicrobiia bacterium]|nr:hypothetical protein [Acidimicrobiia bacterium]
MIAGMVNAVLFTVIVVNAVSYDADPVPVTAGAYPASVRQAFIAACTSTGGTTTICECGFEEIERTIPYDEFVEIDRDLRLGGAIPPEFFAALSRC